MIFFSSIALHAQYGNRYYYADSVSNETFNDGLITNFVLTNGEPVYAGTGKTISAPPSNFERARFVRARLNGTVQNNRKYFIFKSGIELAARMNAISEGNSYFMLAGTTTGANSAPVPGGADILLMRASASGVPSNVFKIDLNAGYDEALCTRRSAKSASNFYTCGYSRLNNVNRAFLMKHNNTVSTVSWVRTFNLNCLNGQNGNAEATAVIDDSASNTVVIVGNVRPVTGGATCQRAFIAKFNASGTLIWLNFVSDANAADIDFQSIRETGVAQQYVITGSIGLPGLNRRVLLYVVNTSGAVPVTVLSRGLFSTGPSPNYPVANQYGYDVVTRIEPSKKEYFICGANEYTTGQTDGILFKTDVNGLPLAHKLYSGVGKEQYNAIDYVSRPGATGNGIAAFGNYVKILSPGAPTKSLSWLTKTYFNLVSGCSELSDNPQSLTLSFQYTAQSITTVKTFTKDSLTSQNSTVLNNQLCWATTVAGGSNTRVAGSGEDGETGSAMSLSIFPNPAGGEQATVVMHSKTEGNVSVRLYDATGKQMDEFTQYVFAGRNEVEIDIADLVTGIFLLQITDKNGVNETVRLMKM